MKVWYCPNESFTPAKCKNHFQEPPPVRHVIFSCICNWYHDKANLKNHLIRLHEKNPQASEFDEIEYQVLRTLFRNYQHFMALPDLVELVASLE